MKKKMLQFVDLKQETLLKEVPQKERVTLTKFIKTLLLIKLKNSQADVLSAEFLSVKYIVL